MLMFYTISIMEVRRVWANHGIQCWSSHQEQSKSLRSYNLFWKGESQQAPMSLIISHVSVQGPIQYARKGSKQLSPRSAQFA